MAEEETYVPLEESAFWRTMTTQTQNETDREKSERKILYPTKLHKIAYYSLNSQIGCVWWSKGCLVSSAGFGTPLGDDTSKRDLRHDASAINQFEAPEENSLFGVVPDVRQDQFLRELNIYNRDNGTDENVNTRLSRVQKFGSLACAMPLDIDVHYLAAEMMMLKHVYSHPDRLAEYGCEFESITQRERAAVREALNNGFDIIRERGLEKNFARSCAELSQKLPFLTTLSEKYVRVQDAEYQGMQEMREYMKAARKDATDEDEVLETIDALGAERMARIDRILGQDGGPKRTVRTAPGPGAPR